MISVTFNDNTVQDAINALVRRVQDSTPAMRAIGEYLSETTRRRFTLGVAPDGTAWAPNRPVTIARYLARYKSSTGKGGGLSKAGKARLSAKKPLTGETKSLGTTINYHLTGGGVAIGSAMEYAAVQQFGARQGAFGRTRKGGPIPWGDIPARPFLGISDSDRDAVLRIVSRHLATGH